MHEKPAELARCQSARQQGFIAPCVYTICNAIVDMSRCAGIHPLRTCACAAHPRFLHYSLPGCLFPVSSALSTAALRTPAAVSGQQLTHSTRKLRL